MNDIHNISSVDYKFSLGPIKESIKENWSFSGIITILMETHPLECSCSYCKENKVGLVLPKNKGATSWRSIRWKYKNKLRVLRWTLPK